MPRKATLLTAKPEIRGRRSRSHGIPWCPPNIRHLLSGGCFVSPTGAGQGSASTWTGIETSFRRQADMCPSRSPTRFYQHTCDCGCRWRVL